jgi:hypothetical protein
MEALEKLFLDSAIKRLQYNKVLGEQTFVQLQAADFHFKPNEESNSIAVIIQHMAGNMLSRWTDFLTTDGEKEWRDRDGEFEDFNTSQEQLLQLWNEGWNCVFQALTGLQAGDLYKTIHIRHEPLVVIDAINRQLAHYPYHVGQIIYIGKLIRTRDWLNLSMEKKRPA